METKEQKVMENMLDREYNAPSALPVYVGLCFTYNGERYEVEQILPGTRAICHSANPRAGLTILSFGAIRTNV